MLATVKTGLSYKDDVLPGPIKLHSKAATVWERAMDDKYESDRAIGLVAACALAASEENARGHIVITAPTGGSAGVMPAIVYALVESKREVPMDKIREGLLAGAAVGYLCKHNATLSAAEGGCQSEIGVASAMAAAFIAQVLDNSPLVIENAAESALEHHLGMTCDPVAGYVQVPCIERCAFGAVKAWTAYMIATNEIAIRHRVDLDTTIKTLADTARDMHPKYKETSEAGLGREPGALLNDAPVKRECPSDVQRKAQGLSWEDAAMPDDAIATQRSTEAPKRDTRSKGTNTAPTSETKSDAKSTSPQRVGRFLARPLAKRRSMFGISSSPT